MLTHYKVKIIKNSPVRYNTIFLKAHAPVYLYTWVIFLRLDFYE